MERRERDKKMQQKITDVKQLVSLKNFTKYDKRVPTMEKVAKMSRHRLYERLTRVPSSIFFRCSQKELPDVLSFGLAVQYFALLCMMNERDKSDLSFVDELASSQEESEHSVRDEYNIEMAISPLASSSLENKVSNGINENRMPLIEESKHGAQNLHSERIQRNAKASINTQEVRQVALNSHQGDARDQNPLGSEESLPRLSNEGQGSESDAAESVGDNIDDRVIPDEHQESPDVFMLQTNLENATETVHIYTMSMQRVNILITNKGTDD